jgi:GMP synthase (glutamine-hydrolysing)
MKIGVLQHAAFEGPGEIAEWAKQRGHSVSICHLYQGDPLPVLDDFDLLVIMGGEMNIYQYRDWPWLKAEGAFVRSALAAGKKAIGICLGAQFLADALGAQVVQNREVELGWLPISWTNEAHQAFPKLPRESTVLHWHGDTFSLPEGATRLAVSEACAEQGFLIPGKCLALQFHMEVDPALVKHFVASQETWPAGQSVQEPKAIVNESEKHCTTNRELLYGMLDAYLM